MLSSRLDKITRLDLNSSDSLSFGRNVRTRMGVAIFQVFGPLIFRIKVGVSREVPCKKDTSELAGLLSTTSLKSRAPSSGYHFFWYDSTSEMNPRPTDRRADALDLICRREVYSILQNRSKNHRRVGVVVRASVSQSVDLGFIFQVESYQKTLKMVFTAYLLGAQ